MQLLRKEKPAGTWPHCPKRKAPSTRRRAERQAGMTIILVFSCLYLEKTGISQRLFYGLKLRSSEEKRAEIQMLEKKEEGQTEKKKKKKKKYAILAPPQIRA